METYNLSKQAVIIQLLARHAGADITELQGATGWKSHTVRGTISATLRKKMGLNVIREQPSAGRAVYRIVQSEQNRVAGQPSVKDDAKSARGCASFFKQDREELSHSVADVISAYMAHYTREGKGVSVTTNMIETHILPHLGEIQMSALTTRKISDWHYALSKVPARTRRKVEQECAVICEDNLDIVRRRRSTANRILTVLKAALNHAWRSGMVDSDTAWRRVQAFRGVTVPIIRYLNENECKKLVKACDPDLRLIVQAALFSGCRYGEIGRLVASDYKADTGSIYVEITKTGKPRHVVLTEEGKDFFESITRNKAPNEPMFKTQSGHLWGKSLQSRKMRIACKRAGIEPPISYHGLRRTYGSLLAMKGTPMAVVTKQLGHANTLITEKHYAHISAGYVAQVVRDSFPHLGIN